MVMDCICKVVRTMWFTCTALHYSSNLTPLSTHLTLATGSSAASPTSPPLLLRKVVYVE